MQIVYEMQPKCLQVKAMHTLQVNDTTSGAVRGNS